VLFVHGILSHPGAFHTVQGGAHDDFFGIVAKKNIFCPGSYAPWRSYVASPLMAGERVQRIGT
jgi:hypothetical protein